MIKMYNKERRLIMAEAIVNVELEESLFHFIVKGIKHVRCDYRDCTKLTNRIFKLQNIPRRLFGEVIPSYEVYLKLCPEHIGKIGHDKLGEIYKFALIGETNDGSYYCICQRCDHSFIPMSFTKELYDINKEEYGRLVKRCPKCNIPNWKLQRYRPVPTRAFVKGETATRAGERIITDPVEYEKSMKEKLERRNY